MGEDLVKIKRRIASISSTRKITNAMELVSSAKLTRKRRVMDNVASYARRVEGILNECLKGLKESEELSGLSEAKPEASKRLFVAITSNMGLCGGYNFNLLKYLNGLLEEGDEVLMIGTKGLSKVDVSKASLNSSQVSLLETLDMPHITRLRTLLVDTFLKGEYKSVQLVYTHYKNALTFIPEVYTLLPFKPQADDELDLSYPPIFVPDRKTVCQLLIPKCLDTILFQKAAEALVSEEGSRRTAMENATDNADELKEQLNIAYNKARQAAITSQITEIMAGQTNDN